MTRESTLGYLRVTYLSGRILDTLIGPVIWINAHHNYIEARVAGRDGRPDEIEKIYNVARFTVE